jgi:hypothetical protein
MLYVYMARVRLAMLSDASSLDNLLVSELTKHGTLMAQSFNRSLMVFGLGYK